jgi:hypothetical protein
VPHIFYQNMQNFGGGTLDRNNEFEFFMGAFPTFLPIDNQGQPGRFAVAAFSEVLNANAALITLPDIVRGLFDNNPIGFVEIFIGTTGGGRDEYIAIAWDTALLQVEHAGSVLRDSFWGAWEAIPANGLPQLIGRPDGFRLAADQRGMAYIAARDMMNQPRIFAFSHNQYAVGDITALRAGFSQSVPRIIAALNDQDYGYHNGQFAPNLKFFIGADFNTAPIERTSPHESRSLLTPVAAHQNGALINTTNSNPYDYWYVSDGNIDPDRCAVWTETRVPRMSDHAGISLYYE